MSEQPKESHTKSIVFAILFSVLLFILVLIGQISSSLEDLNIIIALNRALALSGLLLISLFLILETFCRFVKSGARFLLPAGRTLGFFGFILAVIHAASVLFLLTGDFSREWLSIQSTSVNFAKASIIAFIILFVGFIKTISDKLGERKWLYIQAVGYMGLIFILAHVILLKNLTPESLQAFFFNAVRQTEVIFIFIFFIIIAIIRAFLHFLNKKASLQVKTVAHTLLYLAAGAIILIFYLDIAHTERNYEEIFHSNENTVVYIKGLSGSDDESKIFETTDSITKSSGNETAVFFLNNEKRIIHHPDKSREDRLYAYFKESPEDTSVQNIKREDGGSVFLDTVSRFDEEKYIVVSADYSRVGKGYSRQIFYSAVLIVIVTFTTAIMTLLFGRKNIIKPIKKVTTAANNISAGKFDTKIDIKSNDEFRVLADTFNNMSQTLQKQISDLMKLDKLKNEFIAIASHNLRTPLTTLRGYLDYLEMPQTGKLNKKQKDTIEKAQHSATSLASLTEGLINITSLEREGVKIEKESVNLTDIISEILKEIEPKAKEKKIKIQNKIEKKEIKTIGDAAKLKQAFLSVLENAVKFNKDGGGIVLDEIIDDTKQPTIGRKEFIITIKDTGIGISKEEKENVFQKFNRGTSTYTYTYEGVGLGLYVARLIIQAHHGRIWFESKEGQGTTFYISLTVE
ncbi:HAMP domain-containing protein [candidate division WS5 bacterium]|uniref:histidine kinase n=1 Tax=candidate division WS5 bacterium TaxID=2093353 RepID=A0A419DEH1_9BACT|nr:MAG: HAMP domain-containing protein [candidate division WS5 bacterium]